MHQLLRLFVLSSGLLFPVEAFANGRSMSVESPDGELTVTVDLTDGQPMYAATWRGRQLIAPSACGITLPKAFRGNLTIVDTETTLLDETWKAIVGKRQQVRNHCRELIVKLAHDTPPLTELQLIIRTYDDGFAIRSRIPSSPDPGTADRAMIREQTHFRLAGNPEVWSYQKERKPIGPTKLSKAQDLLAPPLLIDYGNRRFAAIHEADLRKTGWMQLRATDGVMSVDSRLQILTGHAWQTPWRVIQVGESLGDLIDSDILANLNPKADAEAFAWVKPGVALWDWRSWGYNAPDGFKFGLNLESWKRFIDFAAEHDIPYVLLDANWYGPEFEKESNPFTGGVALDVRKAIDYGREHGVGLILYLNDVAAREYGIEKILREWSSWGAAGIKYGFMRARKPAAKVAWTRKIVRLCAENKLLVNFHDGPVPPAGCEATYPNWATREFCHAQSDAKRSFTPTTFLMQMAVNQLAGPLDMNNGMFDLDRSVAERPRVFVEVPATITAEAARTLIVYSGMTVIPDATSVYERHPKLFKFISAQQMPWAESKTLAFELGEHITVMRQTSGSAGDTYLVGSATNEQARELSIPLDFLPLGEKFTALVCEDAADAHFTNNREAYTTRRIDVDASTVIKAQLAPGGGHCLLITPVR